MVIVALVWLVGSPFGWRAEASSDVRFISQRPPGRADGSDWANAAPLRDVPILVAQLSNGGTVLVRTGERPYRVEDPIVLGDRPTDAAVTIRGFDPLGGGARPVLMGTRAEPYSPATAGTGAPTCAPDTGADDLSFEQLAFVNVGNGCFVLRGAVNNLTISGMNATNVRRFIEDEDEDGTSVAGLVIQRTRVLGSSKDAVRLRDDAHDVLIEDVLVDSRRQDGDHFAMGFHLSDTVHDVVFRRVTAMNARDTLSGYRNGDGFVAERGTYALTFEDTLAIGSMDAGYDIKASEVTLVRASASGNKRNFRFWGSDIRMSSSNGSDRIARGGDGSHAQVWAGPASTFFIEDSRFSGGDADTIVFDLESVAAGVAQRTIVRRAPGSNLVHLSEAATMMLNGEWLEH
jgi:hypothetical protein